MSNVREKHPLAGKKCKLNLRGGDAPDIKTGDIYRVEDWWQNVGGTSWMYADGNPACMLYGIRSGCVGLPTDNEVVYGKVGGFGHLIHTSELGEEVGA